MAQGHTASKWVKPGFELSPACPSACNTTSPGLWAVLKPGAVALEVRQTLPTNFATSARLKARVLVPSLPFAVKPSL